MKSPHHSFDIDLAEEYGVQEAILIHHFQHWIRLNRKRNINFHEGKTWTYQTLQEIADYFPYWTIEEVRTILDRLCAGQNRRSKKDKEFDPVLVKRNFNKTPFDKTLWYAFKDESKFLNSNNVYEWANAQIEAGKCPNGEGHMPKPIPDTKTDTKTENSVCNPPPEVGESRQVAESVESEVKIFPPLKIKDFAGNESIVKIDELFTWSVLKKKNWTSQEIYDCWKILGEFKGPIRDVFRFVEGTIDKRRNSARAAAFQKQKDKKCQTTSHTEEPKSPINSSVKFADRDTVRQIWGI